MQSSGSDWRDMSTSSCRLCASMAKTSSAPVDDVDDVLVDERLRLARVLACQLRRRKWMCQSPLNKRPTFLVFISVERREALVRDRAAVGDPVLRRMRLESCARRERGRDARAAVVGPPQPTTKSASPASGAARTRRFMGLLLSSGADTLAVPAGLGIGASGRLRLRIAGVVGLRMAARTVGRCRAHDARLADREGAPMCVTSTARRRASRMRPASSSPPPNTSAVRRFVEAVRALSDNPGGPERRAVPRREPRPRGLALETESRAASCAA